MMGGRVWVDSEIGRGSAFHFTAEFALPTISGRDQNIQNPIASAGVLGPLVNDRQNTDLQLTPSTLRSQAVAGSQNALRVLVAEDNAVNLQLIKRLLEKRGHTVLVANNGRDALRLLETANWNGIDVILMDIQMPEMDGIQATAAIREHEKVTGSHLPIVAITAHVMANDRQKCLEAGMDEYVSKPLDPKTLFAVVDKVVQCLKPN
jgi:CheY-like chemotaxis protein